MTLVVEDGTGIADAESYVGTDDAHAYAAARGLTFPVDGTALEPAEQALRRATQWLDAAYRPRYPGYRANGRQQALEWPRRDAYDQSWPPQYIQPTEIPVEIVHASIEAAVRELAKPGSLSPDVTPGTIKKRVKVEGAVEVEYAVGDSGVVDQRPVATVIDDILGSLLSISRGAPLAGTSERV